MPMSSKELVHSAFGGRPVDRMPVAASYLQLYHQDHFDELTGLPRHHYQKWNYGPTDEFLSTFRTMVEAVPFDMLQVPWPIPDPVRERTEFVEKDGQCFLHDTEQDVWDEIPITTKSGHATDYAATTTPVIHDLADLRRKFPVTRAEVMIREGAIGRTPALVEEFGDQFFIVSGNVVGTIYGCGAYVGQTNALMGFIERPAFMHDLCKHHAERNIERIRAQCSAGGDAVYIDDATATSDMVSPAIYEEFSLPYTKQVVDVAHECNHRIFVVYFGGVADRLDLIAATGADGLAMEASMKGYVNDIGTTARAVGADMTLFGNVNPYDHLERLSDEDLEAVMREQSSAGRQAKGFITAVASPITMHTPLSRVQKFIEIARRL